MKWKGTGSNTLGAGICSLLSAMALANNGSPFLFLSPFEDLYRGEFFTLEMTK